MTAERALMKEVPTEATLRYEPSLDGLRALCVLAVLLYHADPEWLPGGYMGVEVFFVVSGYLITSLILVEWANTKTVSLTQFWLRRARRLLPAVYTLVLVCSIVALASVPRAVHRIRVDIIPVIAYYTNWHYIFEKRSYFMQDQTSVFRHLWSLSIEEQFYCIAPVLLLAALKTLDRRRAALGVVCTAGALASVLCMRLLYVEGHDPSRVYYGLDTRSSGLLFGAALACVPTNFQTSSMGAVQWTGVLAFCALVSVFATLADRHPVAYRFGFLGVDVLSVAVIFSATRASSFLGWLLSLVPLPMLGRISYGIYLWHVPIYEVTRPYVDVPFGGMPNFALRLSVTLLVAWLSYRFVEEPFRRRRAEQVFFSWPLLLRIAVVASWVASIVVVAWQLAERHPPIEAVSFDPLASLTNDLVFHLDCRSGEDIGPFSLAVRRSSNVSTAAYWGHTVAGMSGVCILRERLSVKTNSTLFPAHLHHATSLTACVNTRVPAPTLPDCSGHSVVVYEPQRRCNCWSGYYGPTCDSTDKKDKDVPLVPIKSSTFRVLRIDAPVVGPHLALSVESGGTVTFEAAQQKLSSAVQNATRQLVHVCATLSPGALRLFINGSPTNYTTATRSSPLVIADITINDAPADPRAFSDLSIWRAALSEDQVRQVFAAGGPGFSSEFSRVIIFGDSVVCRGGSYLQAAMPGVRLDCVGGRKTPSLVQQLQRLGPAFLRQFDTVVVSTSSYSKEPSMLAESTALYVRVMYLTTAVVARVIFVSCARGVIDRRQPFVDQNPTEAIALSAALSLFPTIELIDWCDFLKHREDVPDIIYDCCHLTRHGGPIYASMIASKVAAPPPNVTRALGAKVLVCGH